MNQFNEKEWKRQNRSKLLHYDKKRHLQLLNQQIGNMKSDELTDCSIILANQLHWEVRSQYVELVNDYTQNKIAVYEFGPAFEKRYKSIEKTAEILESNRILLSPHENSFDFADLLDTIYTCFQQYSGDPHPDLCEIGPVEFQTEIERVYLEMQKLLNKT